MKAVVLVALLLAAPAFGAEIRIMDLDVNWAFTEDDLSGTTGITTSLTADRTCNLDELLESMKFLLDHSGMYPSDTITSELTVYIGPSTSAQIMRRDAERSKEVADELDRARRVYEECK